MRGCDHETLLEREETPAMIIWLEFLEQILDDDWALSRSIAFVESLGEDGWSVVSGQYQDGLIDLISHDGVVMPEWAVRKVLRTRDAQDSGVMVRITPKGALLV